MAEVQFPPFAPSSREYSDGNWPVKQYRALSGYPVRVLYGSRQTDMSMTLTYNNLKDEDAAKFLEHFQQQKGSYTPFQFDDEDGPKKGWSADEKWLGVAARFSNWTYKESPKIVSVKPGRSTVSVTLVSVLTS